MGYNYSAVDKKNLDWFKNDATRNTLTTIEVKGRIRGLCDAKMHMEYPISAIAGKNGCGKSTILALAACAFHNKTEYSPYGFKKKYYTYGDFFTFAANEDGISNVSINYTINTTTDKKTDTRRKKPSGKWNDFNTRFKRKVAFLGINRIVPPSESNVHKNYKRLFTDEDIKQTLATKIADHMSKIFGHPYKNMTLQVHNTYRLFQVERNHISYSGFNMGAGENAVLQLLIELYTIGTGGLLVIDELELGLHIEAQIALIHELKEICKDQKCQIVCSTHSEYILDALPPEGRFLIEGSGGVTAIVNGVSARYAFGKMAGISSQELDIFTEDEVGAAVVRNYLPANIRERVNIYPIGSDQAVVRQIAAHYRIDKLNCIAFMDGDKRTAKKDQISKAKSALESRVQDNFNGWIETVLDYLPGETWPERYMVESVMSEDGLIYLAERWELQKEEVTAVLEKALAAGKHNEFYSISQAVGLELTNIRRDVILCEAKTKPDDKSRILNTVLKQLNII